MRVETQVRFTQKKVDLAMGKGRIHISISFTEYKEKSNGILSSLSRFHVKAAQIAIHWTRCTKVPPRLGTLGKLSQRC